MAAPEAALIELVKGDVLLLVLAELAAVADAPLALPDGSLATPAGEAASLGARVASRSCNFFHSSSLSRSRFFSLKKKKKKLWSLK